jgi:uncharacterized membrane protein
MHLAAVVVWAGGMVAVPFVAAPVIRRAAGGLAVEALIRRFQRLSWELILIILLTGIFNLILVGALTRFNLSPVYLSLVGLKAVLFFVMVCNQMWYSYKLVPVFAKSGETTRNATWSAVVSVLIAAAILFIGLNLRTV